MADGHVEGITNTISRCSTKGTDGGQQRSAAKQEIQYMAEEYYSFLDEFVQECGQLVKEGLPYLAVISCHELYRFLYPVDPYTNVTNDNPVEFAASHIKSLLEMVRTVSRVVVPYGIDLSAFDCRTLGAKSLERETSELYSGLWKSLDTQTLSEESRELLKRRLPKRIIASHVAGKEVLDMGCGSGRHSIALAMAGAQRVTAVDLQKTSYAAARKLCREYRLPVEFREGDVLELPFDDKYFDFVFCNGVLHHTSSIEKGLQELYRVLKKDGRAFVYLYGVGGIFWTTRKALRKLFGAIPVEYTKLTLRNIGMPSNRFIFCDTWYVPVEIHTGREDLESMLGRVGFAYTKTTGNSPFDLDKAIEDNIRGAVAMWGDGEHRYLLK